MVWGLPIATFTFVHVVLSLVGIGSGFVVMSGLLRGRERNGRTPLFLATTVAASVLTVVAAKRFRGESFPDVIAPKARGARLS